MAVSKNAADDMMRVLSIYDTGAIPPVVAGEAAGEAYGSLLGWSHGDLRSHDDTIRG
jgi:hypothetical protein